MVSSLDSSAHTIECDWEELRDLLHRPICFPALTKHQLSTLAEFISPTEFQELKALNPLQQNRRIRELLGPSLMQAVNRRLAISHWIVSDWGGIRGHDPQRFENMVKALGSFSLPEIEIFTAAHGAPNFDRISSWSKLLSFAHPDHYPVYDAKAVSKLNRLLSATEKLRFYVPLTQVRDLKGYQNAASCYGYEEYVVLLRRASAKMGIPILELESALFARALYL